MLLLLITLAILAKVVLAAAESGVVIAAAVSVVIAAGEVHVEAMSISSAGLGLLVAVAFDFYVFGQGFVLFVLF